MSELTKSIGLGRGTFMMLNIVLGAGLLTLPGLAAGVAGAGAPLVWLACAAAAVPLLVIFAILGRDHPSSGGVPEWGRRAFGEFAYVPTLFLFLGAVCVGLPSIAITGGYYAASVLSGDAYIIAACILGVATLANLMSPDIAGRLNSVIASSILIVLVALAGFGWSAVDPAPAEIIGASFGAFDIATFGLAFMMVFFAFTGWEVAANFGGEFKNARRNLPLAIALSFLIATALYFVLALIVTAAGPSVANEAPFATLIASHYGSGGATLVALIGVLLIYANISAAIWAVSRLVSAVARESLLPAKFAELRNGVPLYAVLLTSGVLLAVTAAARKGVLDLEQLLSAAGLNFLLLYAASAVFLIALSAKIPHRALGAVSILLVVLLAAMRPVEALQYPAALIVCGLIIAAIRSRRSPHPQQTVLR